MRLLSRIGVAAAACALVAFMPARAEAVLIFEPGDEICSANFSDLQKQGDQSFLSFCGISDADLLYKAAGSDSGPFAGSYSTDFIPDQDPEDAIITYDGAPDPTISCPTCYAVVKDGNQDPGWYLFDLGDWDGIETLSFENFWPSNGAISHISIYGTDGGTGGGGGGTGGGGGGVPEPTTLTLLGLGMLGAAWRARKAR